MSVISWSFAIKIASGFIMATCFAIIVWSTGPTLETRFFPVVDKLIVDKAEERPDGVTRIWASFRKLRNCTYIGIAWFRGSRDDFVRVPVILLREEGDTSSPNRPVGYQHAGPWDVSVPLAELPGNSFAQLFHSCHPFWVTTTDFYP